MNLMSVTGACALAIFLGQIVVCTVFIPIKPRNGLLHFMEAVLVFSLAFLISKELGTAGLMVCALALGSLFGFAIRAFNPTDR